MLVIIHLTLGVSLPMCKDSLTPPRRKALVVRIGGYQVKCGSLAHAVETVRWSTDSVIEALLELRWDRGVLVTVRLFMDLLN